MKNITKVIFPILLLGIGFFVGTSWNTKNEQPQNPEETTQRIAPSENDNDAENENYQREVTPRGDLTAKEKTTIQLFEEAAPTVVFINTSKVRMDYYRRNSVEVPQGSGSGFIWDDIGHVVTNFHVIQGADRAQVTLSDGSTYEASLVGGAPEKDLAILRINAPMEALKPIPVGSSDDLLVGQNVLAIGNPFGLDQTLTTGIISALGREIESVSGVPIRDVIQTDAAINPGNSGGPLLDSSGRLIGVNTAIYSPSGAYAGIGFSIPVDVVKWVVPDLIEFGKIQRPVLGIELATPRIAQRFGLEGALVIDVVKGSGAEIAGILPTLQDRRGRIRLGDVITEIDGQKIKSNNDLLLVLENYKAGDSVKVMVLREEEAVELAVVLGATN
jgi:S1-C subfamily serine protease